MIINNIPLRCPKSSKKWFYFNLNNYRKAHYHLLSDTKIWFTTWFLLLQIKQKCPEPPLELAYTIYLKGKSKKADLDNVGAVLNKYMQDALVKKRIIKDDNVDIIKKISFEFGGYDKVGRASLEIKKYKGERD